MIWYHQKYYWMIKNDSPILKNTKYPIQICWKFCKTCLFSLTCYNIVQKKFVVDVGVQYEGGKVCHTNATQRCTKKFT